MQPPGRPREFDPDEILSKIMHLFWENGYEATGLSDIMAETGLGKASLYQTFGNKHEMYLKALNHYEGQMVDAAVAILMSDDPAPLDRIDAFLALPISAVRDHEDRRGCFLCNASADRASVDKETATLVQRGYEKMRRAITVSLSEAFPTIPADKTARMAEVVLTMYSGFRVMARSGQSAEVMMAAKAQILELL